MPHEDYAPASQTPDHSFDPASLYRQAAGTLTPTAEPPTPPAPLRAWLVRLGLGLALLGVIACLVGAHLDARANATRGWVETQAEILDTKLRATAGGEYHLDLSYRYRAGPRQLQSTRIALEPDLSRDAAYDYAARFRPGVRVPVWFDPAAPSSAVLERPNLAGAQAAKALGVLLLLLGLSPFAKYAFSAFRYRLALRRQSAL